MYKNTASQKLDIFVYDGTTGAPKTGDAANLTVYVSIDDGTLTALTDTSATEVSATNAPGTYRFDLSQAETNGNKLTFTGKSATANIYIVPQTLYTNTALASFGLDAVLVESSITGSASLVDDAATQLTSINARQAMALWTSALAGVLSGATGTTVTIKAGGKSTSRIVATVDADGNRSALILTVPT